MAIKKEDYEAIKSAIHMSIVPMCVKELWFKDKKFNKWFHDDRKRQIGKLMLLKRAIDKAVAKIN